jgi:hypothetical protein
MDRTGQEQTCVRVRDDVFDSVTECALALQEADCYVIKWTVA